MNEDSLLPIVQVIYEDHKTLKIIVISLVIIGAISMVSINAER